MRGSPTRRDFLVALVRAGGSSLALGSLPAWARALAAVAPPDSTIQHFVGPLAPAAPPPPDLIARNDWPEHWETSLPALGRSWITRNDRFFVRSHFPAPKIDPATWRLEVTGLVTTPLTLTLAELRRLPSSEAVHVLECAGNGRGLFHLPSTSGTQWERGAVGNATWSGVRLSELLDRAEPLPEARHVWFEAADEAPLPGVPKFLRSIPREKAMADVLLAHAMNGEPLPRLHGGPLRAIVPGWFGMASTKWVTRVRLEASPSDNHFMVKGYRYSYPGEDPASAPPVEELRIKSVLTRPLDGTTVTLQGDKLPLGKVRVQGFAWAGPAGVRLVEVTGDGGRTWQPAGFMGQTAPLAWRAWATEIEVTAPVHLTIMARATDGAGEMQPLDAKPNAGGYGNNSIHQVDVDVVA